eukprot:COSAG01_NODE_4875_length_4661_cov_2.548882_3_plen_105_part_00
MKRVVESANFVAEVSAACHAGMAGQLPGVRELRLQPEEWAGIQNSGGQAEKSPVGGGEVTADTGESTVSFKDLATLVAVVLDRKDAMDRAGLRERNQGACALTV